MMILDSIVETKRREVAERKASRPPVILNEMISGFPAPRNFRQALLDFDCAIIAEVKRRSPSRGLLRKNFNPVGIATAYERDGASAVSVLTDKPFFGGCDADLMAVKDAVSLPVLRKEFIIDPYQITETRAIGADALLLIAAILTERQLQEYQEQADSLGLAALVEVHDRRELEKALNAGASMIGINNRDLKTFKTDLRTSLELAPLIPEDRIIVSESGIRSGRDIETMMNAGIHAFLIGEALITTPDVGKTLKAFLKS